MWKDEIKITVMGTTFTKTKQDIIRDQPNPTIKAFLEEDEVAEIIVRRMGTGFIPEYYQKIPRDQSLVQLIDLALVK